MNNGDSRDGNMKREGAKTRVDDDECFINRVARRDMPQEGLVWLCEACSELKFVIEGSSNPKGAKGTRTEWWYLGHKDRLSTGHAFDGSRVAIAVEDSRGGRGLCLRRMARSTWACMKMLGKVRRGEGIGKDCCWPGHPPLLNSSQVSVKLTVGPFRSPYRLRQT